VWAPTSSSSNADCYLWVYYNIDSTVGVKNFFAYNKITSPTTATVAAVYPICLSGSAGCTGVTNATVYGGGQSIVPGLTDQTSLPGTIQTFLTTPPLPATSTSKPLSYCGQNAATSASKFCYFNVGMTDIRPEDALYATSRALSAYNTTNGLSGLGYGQTGCGAASTNQGCPIYTSQGTGTVFNVLNFAITGTDPVTKATEPVYTTLSTGASPIVVFVSNFDTSNSLGFGQVTSGGSANFGPYVHTDVNHKVLSLTYDGTLHCTGDFLPTFQGSGAPMQVFQREPLSGTYNTFEFTAVRTLSGSAAVANGQNKIAATTWMSSDDSGQELNNNPTTNFGTGTCVGASTVPTSTCGDPLYQTTGTAGVNCGQGVRLRAIGTGELVKGVIGANKIAQTSIPDAIGYAFWGYQNFAPLVSKTNCTEGKGNLNCSSYAAHYLAVDGVDPFWPATGTPLDGSAAFNLPQCSAIVFSNAADFPCFQVPFTHVKDGSYPLWSLLRMVTFGNVGTTTGNPCTGSQTQCTPAGVINTVAYAETEASSGSTQLSDFVGFLAGLKNSGTFTKPNWTGSLNLGVFRSHYLQSKVSPDNGHYQLISTGVYGPCNPSSINLVGAVKSTPVCWIDVGGDVGGSVLTVQSDLDFINDFGLTSGGAKNPPNPVELYGLHQ